MDRRIDKDFDFEYWSGLAASDPERFERERRAAVEAVIAGAPAPTRRRLEGLQWQVDRIRDRSSTPLSACVKLSKMMWEAVAGERGLLENLDQLSRLTSGRPARPRPARAPAEVLRLEPRRPAREER